MRGSGELWSPRVASKPREVALENRHRLLVERPVVRVLEPGEQVRRVVRVGGRVAPHVLELDGDRAARAAGHRVEQAHALVVAVGDADEREVLEPPLAALASLRFSGVAPARLAETMRPRPRCWVAYACTAPAVPKAALLAFSRRSFSPSNQKYARSARARSRKRDRRARLARAREQVVPASRRSTSVSCPR